MRWATRYLADSDGASAVEFAIVAIPFFALVFAIIWMGLLLYSDNQLQQATEAAARCWSVNPQCAGTTSAGFSTSATNTYAQAQYKGIETPTFTTPTNPGSGCGHQVQGTVQIPLEAIVYNTTVTVTSLACFP